MIAAGVGDEDIRWEGCLCHNVVMVGLHAPTGVQGSTVRVPMGQSEEEEKEQ